MYNKFFKFVLSADIGKTAASRGTVVVRLVRLFVEVSREAVIAGTGASSEAGTSGEHSLRR